MVLNKVFDEVFRTWSNVAVMRALLDTTTGFSGNEVARVAGMNPRSAFKALTLLEELGIVKRQIGGRDHIFTINRESYLFQEAIQNVFKVESNLLDEVIKNLTSILKNKVNSALIFGSVARREDNPLSDLDICCIVDRNDDMSDVKKVLDGKSTILYKRFGIKLMPVFFTKSEFVKKKKTKLIQDIINEGILITGKNPKGLINGKKKREKVNTSPKVW